MRKIRKITDVVIGSVLIVMVCATAAATIKTHQAKPDLNKEVGIQAVEAYSINPQIRLTKIGASNFQNEMIAYAYKISGKDFSFIQMIEAESGWVVDAVGINSGGSVDYGLCQINGYFHRQIVTDPKFNDWKWEIDTCYQMYAGGVTFYGASKIDTENILKRFEFISK